MSAHCVSGTCITLGKNFTPPTDPSPHGTGINMPCTITADSLTKGEVPVYIRQVDDHMQLVDAAGNQIGEQESLTLGTFEFDSINKVTTTLAYQGFWSEGVAKEAEAKRLALVVELLRADESVLSRKASGRAGNLSPLATEALRTVNRLLAAGDLILVDDAFNPGKKVLRLVRAIDLGVEGGVQMGQTFSSGVLRSDDLQAEMQSGEAMTAVGFAINPLESAISETVRILQDQVANPAQSSTAVGLLMLQHLKDLLALQLKRAERAAE